MKCCTKVASRRLSWQVTAAIFAAHLILFFSVGLFSDILGNAGAVQPAEYGQLLAEGEAIEVDFRLVRDVFIFTTKRLILVDKQDLTGRKIEYLSVGYRSISRFSIETAGHFDLDTELKIWGSSEALPSVTHKFTKQVNIYDVQRVLARHVLG